MKAFPLFVLVMLSISVAILGCSGGVADKAKKPEPEAQMHPSFAKLSPEDQRLAQAQGRCPVTEDLLGSMGTPVKVTVGEEPVFLCCKACQKQALSDAAKTLSKVKEFKAKTTAP